MSNRSPWGMTGDTAPPDRHADRVIAAMLRELAAKRASIAPAIFDTYTRSKDGGPRAQLRMAERIRKAGAIEVHVATGTRGRYTLTILELIGFDPTRNHEIGVGDAIPEKPWLAIYITRVRDRGRDVSEIPLLFITHHMLSRCAQRFGLRLAEEIVLTAKTLWTYTVTIPANELLNPPATGHRVEIPTETGSTAIVILRKHESRPALIATTMLFKEGEAKHE